MTFFHDVQCGTLYEELKLKPETNMNRESNGIWDLSHGRVMYCDDDVARILHHLLTIHLLIMEEYEKVFSCKISLF